jgi:hypothetical protein
MYSVRLAFTFCGLSAHARLRCHGIWTMLTKLKKFARIIVLIMVGIATGLLWMYCSGFLPHDLARGGESPVLADRAAGVITGLSAVYPGMGGSTGHRTGFAMLEGGVDWMAIALGAWAVSRIRQAR